MTAKYFFTSLMRVSDLPEVSFSVEPQPREVWDAGDYVLGEVDSSPSNLGRIELTSDRIVEVVEGDLILGAFGKRYATLEAAGDAAQDGMARKGSTHSRERNPVGQRSPLACAGRRSGDSLALPLAAAGITNVALL